MYQKIVDADTLNVIPDVWSPTDAQEPVAADAREDGEAILFGQASRIDRALAAMSDAPSSKPRAFS